MREETSCQIGYNHSQKAQLKNHPRLNQGEETLDTKRNLATLQRINATFSIHYLYKEPLQSQRVNRIISVTVLRIPNKIIGKKTNLLRDRCQNDLRCAQMTSLLQPSLVKLSQRNTKF